MVTVYLAALRRQCADKDLVLTGFCLHSPNCSRLSRDRIVVEISFGGFTGNTTFSDGLYWCTPTSRNATQGQLSSPKSQKFIANA